MSKSGKIKDMSVKEKMIKPGEKLFEEGQQAHSLYLIQAGVVSIRKKKKSEQIEVAKLGSNQLVGELSFFDKKLRSATAIAITPVKVLEIDYPSFEKAYATVPPYFRSIIEVLSERLRRTNEAVTRLQKASSKEDLAIPESEDHIEDADGAAVLAAIAGTQPEKKPDSDESQ